MIEETQMTALAQLQEMTAEDIRTRLTPVLVSGEALSDDDCERIRAYAENRLHEDASLSLDDIFMDGAAVRLGMQGVSTYASVSPDGRVVAVGTDATETTLEGQQQVSE